MTDRPRNSQIMASPRKGNKIGNNNQEEKKEDDSDYGIEDFDNESVRSSKKIASMSEDEVSTWNRMMSSSIRA